MKKSFSQKSAFMCDNYVKGDIFKLQNQMQSSLISKNCFILMEQLKYNGLHAAIKYIHSGLLNY